MNIMDFMLMVINTFADLWQWLITQVNIAGYEVAPITLIFSALIFAGIIRAVL